MVYILTSTQTILETQVRPQESKPGDSVAKALLHLKMKQQLTSEAYDEQSEYLSNAAIAAYVSLNGLDQRQRYRASINLNAINSESFNFTQGSSSSGLGYALSLFSSWWTQVLSKPTGLSMPIFATGEVLTSGQINSVSHISDKIQAAYDYVKANQLSFPSFYFCYPQDNESDVTDKHRQMLAEVGGVLVPAARLQSLLGELLGDIYDGDPLGRWEPFKGLKSFEYEDSVRFFGRDQEVERLYEDLQRSNGLLLVTGASGSGKTSLVKAGLIPRIEKKINALHWLVVTPAQVDVRNGFLLWIVQEILKSQGVEYSDTEFAEYDELSFQLFPTIKEILKTALEGVSSHSSCLIVIDQFEDVFNDQKLEQTAVVECLKILECLVEEISFLNVILNLRSEYLGRLLDLSNISSPFISNISSNLSPDDWFEVVNQQASFSAIKFEQDEYGESLDKKIISEAINTDYALPMVEFLLTELFELARNKDGSSTLKYSHYLNLGGLSGAIAYRAESIAHEAEKRKLYELFDTFVGLGSEGQAYPRLVNLDEIENNKPLHSLVHRFIDASLIVSIESTSQKNLVKLAHDSLFLHWGQLNRWISDRKDYLEWRLSIDGSFYQWKANHLNEKTSDYLLKDKGSIKEGYKYLNKGYVDNKDVVNYLKKSKVGYVFQNIKHFLLVLSFFIFFYSLYQWDYQREKAYYYKAIGERWGVPFGISEVNEESFSHREKSYRLDYKEDRLIRLSIVNSHDYPKEYETSLMEYTYTEEGQVNSVIEKNFSGKILRKLDYKFNDHKAYVSIDKIPDVNVIMPTIISDYDHSMKARDRVIKYTIDFSENGYILRKIYTDSYDNIVYEDDHAGYDLKYNSDGLIVSKTYLDDQMEVLSKEEFSYENHEVESLSVYGVQNLIHRVKYIRDRWGNIIELLYHDLNGNRISNSDGLSRVFRVIDDQGNIREVYNYNINDELFDSTTSTAIIKSSYDYKGYVVDKKFYDHNGRPDNSVNGFSSILWERNYLSNSILISKFGLIDTSRFCPQVEQKFDQAGNVVIERCFTLDGKKALFPIIGRAPAFHEGRLDFDQTGRVTRMVIFDENNKSVEIFGGAKGTYAEYDSKGNIIAIGFIDSDGNAASTLNGIFKYKYLYNNKNDVVEVQYLSSDGSLVEVLGYAAIKHKFDNQGRLIQEEYYDKEYKPTAPYEYHRKEFIYYDDVYYPSGLRFYNELGDKVYPFYTSHSAISYDDVETKYTTIKVDSFPSNSEVFINDESIGKTPINLYLKEGVNEISIRKSGFKSLKYVNYLDSSINEVFFDLKESIDVDLSESKWMAKTLAKGTKIKIYEYFDNGELKDKDIAELIGFYKALSNNGDSKSLVRLGDFYQDGRVIKKDYVKANEFYEIGSKLGDTEAATSLAINYIYGNGIDVNYERAKKLLETSAKKSDHRAQYYLGRLLLKEDQRDKAYNWLSSVIKSSDEEFTPHAASLLCAMTQERSQEAFRWCSLSEYLDGEGSSYFLGKLYLNHLKNPQQAQFWLERSSEISDSYSGLAEESLGMMFEYGLGVDIDYLKAADWYIESAKRGHEPAARALYDLTRSEDNVFADERLDDFYAELIDTEIIPIFAQ